MQYRDFGKTGFKASTFGLGCMRLPLEKQPDGKTDNSKIDKKQAIEMVHYAIDHGVNYIDTAYPYHNGNSELLLAEALKDGYRERIKLATKSPIWLVKTYDDFERILDEQLRKLEVDYVDFYLLHSLTKEYWDKAQKLDVFKFLDKAIQDGKIKYAGFSFHDEFSLFKNIIDSYDWSMCQIQFNILDEYNQAGVEGLRYAASKGIPVVIMEPLRGGKLAQNNSGGVMNIWNQAGIKRSPVDWAFRWICNFPETTVVLSGVSSLEQLKEDIDIFDSALPGSMSEEEVELVGKVQDFYKSRIRVGCTGCGYCIPCPSGVNIPEVFSIYNDAFMFDEKDKYEKKLLKLNDSGKGASSCKGCKKCENVCPQKIPIAGEMKKVQELLKV